MQTPGAGIGGESDNDRSGVPDLWRRAFGERPVLPQLRLTNRRRQYDPEYKQVTVLFADVVHSTDIAATVKPSCLDDQ